MGIMPADEVSSDQLGVELTAMTRILACDIFQARQTIRREKTQ
jgi:hypothetical protein